MRDPQRTIRSGRLAGELAVLLLSLMTLGGHTQKTAPPEPLDPARSANLSAPVAHVPLPEEYIWTADGVTAKRTAGHLDPQGFRAHFRVSTVPLEATLYLAGPREMTVWLNGQMVGHRSSSPDSPINFRVFHFDVHSLLHAGDNVLAVEAVRGHGTIAATSSAATLQLAYGEVLAAKLLPARFGDDASRPLLLSDTHWRAMRDAGPNDRRWTEASFDDTSWPVVVSLGGIESNVDLRQWSADAGMYGWPGYLGISDTQRLMPLHAAAVTHVYAGRGSFEHLDALTSGRGALHVHQEDAAATDAEAPSLLLDFGREVAGRLYVEADGDEDSRLSIAYGESELEALATGLTPQQRGGNYLGTNLLDVPAKGIVHGPKSAFRYVRIRFLRVGKAAVFPSIRAELITPDVRYVGSFHSSDPLLDRIWETGAYTARLCMQDDVWDAPKRDRGRWAGDLDIENRTIYDAFGNTGAIEATLARLAAETRPDDAVNGIASYTAAWIVTLGRLYQYSGDRAFVVSQHDTLLRLLAHLDGDLDPMTGVMKTQVKGWGFVDWSPGLYGTSPEVTAGSTLQYLRAYMETPMLLRAAGDEANARRYEERVSALREAARKRLLDVKTHTAGDTWQLNALAVLTGLPDKGDDTVWRNVLSHVKQNSPQDQVISPYFNAYVLDAMSAIGHQQQALDWIRTYWGGMLAEGATSFWESYDLRWQKNDFHLGLQADGTSGFFVSLAHGWSTGPVAWLEENVLGVEPTAPGYRAVRIAPRLLGLASAGGSVPTPHGVITVEMKDANGAMIELPEGVDDAEIVAPSAAMRLTVDGKSTNTGDSTAHVHGAGRHVLEWRCAFGLCLPE